MGYRANEGRVRFESITGTCRYLVDTLSICPTCWCQCYLRAVQDSLQGIPYTPGLMWMKATEFMRLTQGTKTLTEYMHAFNNLSRYAPEFVNTKEKNIESFKWGLGTKLMKTMTNSRCATYNEFVSDALTQENLNNLHATSKGHKWAAEAGALGSSQSKAPMATRP